MCGISGIAIASREQRLPDRDLAIRMRDVIAHRGPDDSGMFIDGSVALGHRRLSIVDVSAGHQPMTNEDGTLHIIFNGEIYNHGDFRQQLIERGHSYRTHCDTETILHLYEEYGSECVEKLRGMFAFAIWDANRGELFIARDRLGVKPLYYAISDRGTLFFGSEIKSLLVHGAVRAELNYQSLPGYLANHASYGEETMFKGIRRLMPGHRMLWKAGEIRIDEYWDVHFENENKDELSHSQDSELVNQWLELFRESVRLRLMADVPLGMFLSGGIDSSAIAAVMSRMVSDPIKTFSVAFEEREANELEYARIVSKAFATDHHETVVSPEDFFSVLPHLVWHEDEPIAHPSSVALYFVSKLASEHVKVVLTGEGSDEMLAGYGRYRKTIFNLSAGRRYQKITPSIFRKLIHKSIEALPRGLSFAQKLERTFLFIEPDIESIYFDNFAVFGRDHQKGLLTQTARNQISNMDPYIEVTDYLAGTDAKTLLNRLLYADIKTYLHELLMKQDQMSMAASIESRVPFLDHKLVEFTSALPERMKLRGLTTKYILRESMKNILPNTILNRPKMGFPVPVGAWFRGSYRHIVDEYVLGSRARQRNIFDSGYTKQIVDEHARGVADHSERLWSLVNFEIWMRQFIDGDVAESDCAAKESQSLEMNLVSA